MIDTSPILVGMKALIRIARSTIRKNPNAGNTTTVLEGLQEIQGVINGDIPEEYRDVIRVTSSTYSAEEPAKHEFILIKLDAELFKVMFEDKRISGLTWTRDPIEISHLPEPAYFFDYENTPVQCGNCKQFIPFRSIITEGTDEYEDEICPECRERNTFDYEYEKIDDVI